LGEGWWARLYRGTGLEPWHGGTWSVGGPEQSIVQPIPDIKSSFHTKTLRKELHFQRKNSKLVLFFIWTALY